MQPLPPPWSACPPTIGALQDMNSRRCLNTSSAQLQLKASFFMRCNHITTATSQQILCIRGTAVCPGCQLKGRRWQPARTPFAPATLRPFFLMMKLVPMNTAELHASASPLAWSADRTRGSVPLGCKMGPSRASTSDSQSPKFWVVLQMYQLKLCLMPKQ